MSHTIVVGLSGGIDSAVALYLLHKAGHRCIGVQMRYWAEEVETCSTANRFGRTMHNKCCSDESMLISREICDFLGVPFYAHDVQEDFYDNIVAPYIKQYNEGLTPNPCTNCNRTIKFGALMDFARSLGATHVATGHYAQITQKKDGTYALAEARDETKDQSYFLYALTQEQLQHILLPLGGMTKTAVREIAEKAGLTMFKKTYKESQGLCFFPERTPDAFLERHSNTAMRTPGPMITPEGKTIGQHKGLAYYTVGQRRGIDLGGLPEPYFVLERKIAENTVVVGPKQYLYTKDATLDRLTTPADVTAPRKVEARIRYRMQRSPAILVPDGTGGATLHFQDPVFAITPGQIAVLYEGDSVLGGGRIIASR